MPWSHLMTLRLIFGQLGASLPNSSWAAGQVKESYSSRLTPANLWVPSLKHFTPTNLKNTTLWTSQISLSCTKSSFKAAHNLIISTSFLTSSRETMLPNSQIWRLFIRSSTSSSLHWKTWQLISQGWLHFSLGFLSLTLDTGSVRRRQAAYHGGSGQLPWCTKQWRQTRVTLRLPRTWRSASLLSWEKESHSSKRGKQQYY